MKTYPSLRDVYRYYGVQLPAIGGARVSDWQVPVGFGQEVLEIMESLALKYKPRPMPSVSFDDAPWPPPDVELEKLILYDGSMKSDPAVRVCVFEVAGISSMIERHRKQWALWLSCKRGSEKLAEGFLLHENRPVWNFSHRMVSSVYRGVGLFGHIASGLEGFVQALPDQADQTVYLSTGQPDVALTFLNRGYLPSDDRESTRLEMMLHASPELMLAYAQRPRTRIGGDIHEEIPPEQTSLYCFDRSVVGEAKENLIVEKSFRVRLEKMFSR